MSHSPKLWEDTYRAQTPEELNAAYKRWAPVYDRDTVGTMGYVGPTVAATLLDDKLDSKKARVLDAGCGTGLVGEILRDRGYQRIEAMDYSPDMLEVAKQKECYCNTFRADMNQPLDIPDDTYDAAICVGTFTYAHVGPEAFSELARITRPDGFVCFTIRDGAYQKYGYRDKMLELESEDSWELQTMVEEDYLIKEDVRAKFCVYKVLEA